MSIENILSELQDKLGLTMHGLSKRLGFKSTAHVFLLKKGDRVPTLATCKKIIDLCEENNIPVSIDMFYKDEKK
jgi:hypothetical protein